MIIKLIKKILAEKNPCAHEYAIHKEISIHKYETDTYNCYCSKCYMSPVVGLKIISRCKNCGDIKLFKTDL